MLIDADKLFGKSPYSTLKIRCTVSPRAFVEDETFQGQKESEHQATVACRNTSVGSQGFLFRFLTCSTSPAVLFLDTLYCVYDQIHLTHMGSALIQIPGTIPNIMTTLSSTAGSGRYKNITVGRPLLLQALLLNPSS